MNEDEIRAQAAVIAEQMSAAVLERSLDLVKTFALEHNVSLDEIQLLVAEAAIHSAFGVTLLVMQEQGLGAS